jgi:hypothetical protein
MDMLVDENGEKRQMNENEKIREYFLNAESRLPEDRPHDKVEFKSNVETMIEAKDVFQQTVVTPGENEGSLLVNVDPLTPNEDNGEQTSPRQGSSNGKSAGNNRHIYRHVLRHCPNSVSGWKKAG